MNIKNYGWCVGITFLEGETPDEPAIVFEYAKLRLHILLEDWEEFKYLDWRDE